MKLREKVESDLERDGRFCAHADDVFPAAEHGAFGPAGLDGLKAAHGFDQQRVFLGRFLVAAFDGAFQRALHDDANQDHDGRDHGRNKGDGASDVEDDGNEQDQKGQIHQCKQCGGTEELTQGIELAHVVDERSRGFGFVIEADGQNVAHELAGHQNVGVAAGHVHEIAAQVPEREVEKEGDADTHRQHPQGLKGVVGHDPIIHVHGEKRRGDGQQVDENRSQDDVSVNGQKMKNGAPEPLLGVEDLEPFGPAVQAGLGAGEDGVSGVGFFQLLDRGVPKGASGGLGHDDAGRAGRHADQHAGRAVLHEQDAGQVQGGDFVDDRFVRDLGVNAFTPFAARMTA